MFDDEKLHDEIKTELENKLNKLVERELYSTYCTAATPAERENARKNIWMPREYRRLLDGDI